MIKIENVEVLGWEHAIRGMRNPLNSWDKSDSEIIIDYHSGLDNVGEGYQIISVGANDLDLMNRLAKAGTDHRKFMRMITVYADITAPLYWWSEYDTYKVGTVANSCSKMHTIHTEPITRDDFSCEHLDGESLEILDDLCNALNICRDMFLQTKDKKYWWQMIQLLPSSYNQRRTVQLNYEVLTNMYHSRKSHKLDEWRELCKWIKSLPYNEIITGGN